MKFSIETLTENWFEERLGRQPQIKDTWKSGIPNDGFRELRTTTKADFPRFRNAHSRRESPVFMSPEKAMLMLPQYKELPCPWIGFKYSTPTPQKKELIHRRQTSKVTHTGAAGMSANSPFSWMPTYKKDLLAAEILRSSNDPQHATEIQKTWVPGGDPGLRVKKTKFSFGFPTSDNENSLPLGEGCYAKRNKSEISKGNRRVRTDITMATKLHLRMGLR